MAGKKTTSAASSGAESSPVHVFLGSDEARVREDALRKARELTPADNQDFGLEIVNGSAETAEHAAAIVRQTIEGLNTLPFFGGDKTVWLQGANFLAETVTGKSASAQAAVERLGALLEAGLPKGVFFILSATEIDKRRSFYKLLTKVARMTVHDLPEPGKPGFEADCMRLVQQRAGKLGLELDARALELFVAMTGDSSRTLDMELEKLAAYVGQGKRAGEDDVRAIVAQTRSGIIFEIGDALAQRQLPRTLDLIDQQLAKGESAIAILLAAVVPRVRGLLVARELTERHGIRVGAYPAFQAALGKLPAQATAHLPRNKDGSLGVYPLFLAAKTCHRFTTGELAEGLKACLEANLKLVTTQTDPRTVLSQLVVGLLQRPPAAP